MMSTTRHSEQKNDKNVAGAFAAPRSRASEGHYGDEAEAKSSDCKNDTQFKERQKDHTELTQVSIS